MKSFYFDGNFYDVYHIPCQLNKWLYWFKQLVLSRRYSHPSNVDNLFKHYAVTYAIVFKTISQNILPFFNRVDHVVRFQVYKIIEFHILELFCLLTLDIIYVFCYFFAMDFASQHYECIETILYFIRYNGKQKNINMPQERLICVYLDRKRVEIEFGVNSFFELIPINEMLEGMSGRAGKAMSEPLIGTFYKIVS